MVTARWRTASKHHIVTPTGHAFYLSLSPNVPVFGLASLQSVLCLQPEESLQRAVPLLWTFQWLPSQLKNTRTFTVVYSTPLWSHLSPLLTPAPPHRPTLAFFQLRHTRLDPAQGSAWAGYRTRKIFPWVFSWLLPCCHSSNTLNCFSKQLVQIIKPTAILLSLLPPSHHPVLFWS